jgi:ElaB/YqjD/DUF883 family membrane-anchored ribosome-binding protein
MATLTSGATPIGSNLNTPGVDTTAQNAHNVVDRVASSATSQVDRLSGAAHQAVQRAADAANTTAQWAAALPEQAKHAQAKITDAACASIRARPITTVAGALVVGYLLGRLARL